MGNLENKLRIASEEIYAIRAQMDILKSGSARQKAERNSADRTFYSVRKNLVHSDSLGGKSPLFSHRKTSQFTTLQDQFTHLADLDQFVFSNQPKSKAE
jgi:hypothetical protein